MRGKSYYDDRTKSDLKLEPKVSDWEARKPVKPDQPKPEYRDPISPPPIGLALVMAGLVIGSLICITGSSKEDETILTIGIISTFVLPFALPIGYVVIGMTYESINNAIVHRYAVHSGWQQYYEDFEAWEKEGGALMEKSWGADLFFRISIALKS